MRISNLFIWAFALAVVILFAKYVFAFTSSDNSGELYKAVQYVEAQKEKALSVDDLKNLAIGNKSCSTTRHGNRGVPPIGYLKGMALTFAKDVCKGEKEIPLGSAKEDALTYYGLSSSLKNTYAFLIGLGMRESSGQYWEGIDATANNVSSDTCEAGLFQASYNSRTFILKTGLAVPQVTSCFMPVWKEGISIKTRKNYGTGKAGLQFQTDVKACPAYAAEWAARVIRRGRAHFGPINRKEVHFEKGCLAMLETVEAAVKKSPSICSELK